LSAPKRSYMVSASATHEIHSSSSANSKIGRLMVAVMFRLWREVVVDVVVAVGVLVTPSASRRSEGAGTGTPATLKPRRCPSGRAFRLGARGRCLPRARPPICGSSKVADRHRYRTTSYTSRATHGPNVTTERNNCYGVSGGRLGENRGVSIGGVRRF
jgi:hypothetical protein